MENRSIIIFSLFIAVAMIVSVFAFLYRNQTDLLIDRYISKITICGNILNEQDCFAKDFCEGIYGSTCPDCQDLEFRRCQRIPLNVLSQMRQEEKQCQITGGQWYQSELGNFCLCQKAGMNKVFDKQKGCVDK